MDREDGALNPRKFILISLRFLTILVLIPLVAIFVVVDDPSTQKTRASDQDDRLSYHVIIPILSHDSVPVTRPIFLNEFMPNRTMSSLRTTPFWLAVRGRWLRPGCNLIALGRGTRASRMQRFVSSGARLRRRGCCSSPTTHTFDSSC